MKLKKALVLIFVFMVSFLAFNKEVFADDYVQCDYIVTKGKDIDTSWKVDNGTVSIIRWDNGRTNTYCTMTYGVFSGGCDKSISSLPVYDSNEKVFYCPNKIYLNKDGTTTFSVAATHRTDGEAYFVLSNPTIKGISKTNAVKIYTPAEQGDNGTLKACASGGKASWDSLNNGSTEIRYTSKDNNGKDVQNSVSTNITKLSRQEQNISGADAASMISQINAMKQHIQTVYYTKVNNTDYPKFCYFSTDDKLQEINDKIKGLNSALTYYTNVVKKSTDLNETQKKQAEQIANNAKNLLKDIPRGTTITSYDPGDDVIDCAHLIDEDLKAVIQLVLKWVRIGAPILLIILMSVDFGQAVISQDQDAMKKATSKAVKRAIAAVALFFVPLLVSVMINWVDSSYFDKNASNCEEVLR